jgi:hypothetical protein
MHIYHTEGGFNWKGWLRRRCVSDFIVSDQYVSDYIVFDKGVYVYMYVGVI